MASKILPLLLIAGMTMGGAAFAGTTAATTTAATTAATTKAAATTAVAATPADVTGAISKISSKGLYIVVDGWKYHVAKGFSFSDLKVGEKVTISYTMKGKLHEASSVKAA